MLYYNIKMNTIVDRIVESYEPHDCPGTELCTHDFCLNLSLWNTWNQPKDSEPPPLPEQKKQKKQFLVTFTKDPKVTTDHWFSRLCKQLQRKFVKRFQCSLEHLDSNIHAHVVIRSDEYLRKRHFAAFPGHVDCRTVRTDNGVSDYISKENKIFDDIIKLREFYSNAVSQEVSSSSTSG